VRPGVGIGNACTDISRPAMHWLSRSTATRSTGFSGDAERFDEDSSAGRGRSDSGLLLFIDYIATKKLMADLLAALSGGWPPPLYASSGPPAEDGDRQIWSIAPRRAATIQFQGRTVRPADGGRRSRLWQRRARVGKSAPDRWSTILIAGLDAARNFSRPLGVGNCVS